MEAQPPNWSYQSGEWAWACLTSNFLQPLAEAEGEARDFASWAGAVEESHQTESWVRGTVAVREWLDNSGVVRCGSACCNPWADLD